MSFQRVTRTAAIVAILVVVAMGAVYVYIVSGGLIARQKPSAIEAGITRRLLRVSVPKEAKLQKNPLLTDLANQDISAGRDLYQQKCEICHGYDGSGKTEAGSGQYPPPLDLRGTEVSRATDGELFYFIRKRHPEHRDAGLADAGSGYLATCPLRSEPA